MKSRHAMVWLALAVLLIANLSAGAAESHPRIVTSFFPLYCWTMNVAGTNAVVENLLPPRAEPHEYAFTPGDARKLAAADLIVVNGLGLEPWLPKYLRGSSASEGKLIKASDGLAAQLLTDTGRHANPHVWLDPQLAAQGVSNILIALQRADPAHASAYASNAHAYIATLQKLDADIRQSLASATNRALVTYHDAFPYFARRYGLEIAGVVEQVPEVNPTPKYLAHLSRTMRERGLHAIFIPPNSSSRLARRIATDLRADLVELDTLETGPLVASAYEEHMRHNAQVLAAALQKNPR